MSTQEMGRTSPPPGAFLPQGSAGRHQGTARTERTAQPAAPLTAVELVAVIGTVRPAIAAQLVPDTAPRVTHEHRRARCRGQGRPEVCSHHPCLPQLAPRLTLLPHRQPHSSTEAQRKTLARPQHRLGRATTGTPGQGSPRPIKLLARRLLKPVGESWPGVPPDCQ